MRFLVDASISPVVVRVLREAGHDAVHVGEVLRLNAPDVGILEHAAREERVIVAADTDLGDLLASRTAALLLANLSAVEMDLRDGAIVVVEQRRVRVRPLPIADTGIGQSTSSR